MVLNVCIGIPVYNEEQRIYELLESVISQKGSIYSLRQIVVVNDGSTDRTLYEIEKFKKRYENLLAQKSIRFYIVSLPHNLGMANAINIITRMTHYDVLVIIASDVVLNNVYTIEELVREFAVDENIGYVAGWRVIYSKHKDIITRTLRFSDVFLEKLGSMYSKPIFVAGGGGMIALRRAVYRDVFLPKTVRIDALLYLYCLSRGYKFRFNPKAKVLYKIDKPMSFYWYIKTQKRVHSVPKEHELLFSNCSLEYKRLPNPFLLVKIFITSFVHYPIDGFCYIIAKLLYIVLVNVIDIKVSYTWRR
jgi:glycosyltransferase involved in cell wall biosynthesis